jgi:hypothetical protein
MNIDYMNKMYKMQAEKEKKIKKSIDRARK